MKTLADAIALYQQERYVDAARRLQLVTQFEPENVEAWMYLGASQGKLGQWEQAVEALRQVVRLRPDQVSGYYELANALVESGDRSSAQAVIDQGTSLDPDHPSLAALRLRLGGEPEPIAPEVSPSSAPTPRHGLIHDGNRLPLLLALLAIVFVLTLIAFVRGGRQPSGSLPEAEKLLAQARAERAALLGQPGEDFDVQHRVGQLAREAESYAVRAYQQQPKSPAVYAALSEIAELQSLHDNALRYAEEGLSLLRQSATPNPPLEARLLLSRAVARAGLAVGAGYASAVAQVRADAQQAQRLDPTAVDPQLSAWLASRR